MLKKLASLTLAAALVTALSGTSAFASSSPRSNSSKDQPHTRLPFIRLETSKGPINKKIRINMLRLVSEARAGKIAPAEHPQIQPARSNSLSKGTKIAIGVGIAAAIVTVVLIIRKPRLTGSAL